MFKRIMAPVDLRHLDQLRRALTVTAEAARQHNVPVTYVSVTSAAPSELAHNPSEFSEKLEAFVKAEGESHGIDATAHMIVSHDPAVDLDDVLMKAVDEVGADLVIMGSHKPGMMEYFWLSNGGAVASHSGASVFLVRNP